MDKENMYDTPPRQSNSQNKIIIPATPSLDLVGAGTGVLVWQLKNSGRSPWAIKNVWSKAQGNRKKIYDNMIENEAKILKEIQHENIVGFRGLLKGQDGRSCLAMELCGRSLGDMAEERDESSAGPFPANQITKVLKNIGTALKYLHEEKRLLHGDVKPHNILVKGDFDSVKLCDLGVCVRLNEDGTTDSYVGTNVYNAPEVISEEEESITDKAEIFSLGLVIWEMITLQTPHMPDFDETGTDSSSFFETGTGRSTVSLSSPSSQPGTEGTRPPLPSVIPSEYAPLVDIFIKCTEEDPKNRPSASQILDMLK